MRYLFIVLFACIIFNSQAQSVKNQQFVGWRCGTNNVKLKSFPNKDRSLNCVVVTSPDSLIANVYNSKLEVVYSFRTRNYGVEETPDNVIGGFFKDNLITVILNNKYSDYLVNIVFNTTDLSTTGYKSIINLDDKRFVGTVNAGNMFYHISSSKKVPSLIINSFMPLGILNENTYFLNKGTNTKLTDKELIKALTVPDGLGRSSKMALIDNDIVSDADEAVFKNKIYLKNDSLILTVDDTHLETKIFKLDLNSTNVSYKSIVHNSEKDSLGNLIIVADYSDELMEKSYNSTIIDNLLYHVFVTEYDIKLSATNLTNGQLVAIYKTNHIQDIIYKNTDIIQEGTSASSTQVKKLNCIQFFRKILRGSAVLTGIRNANNQHQLTVGGYKRLQSGGGGGFGAGGFGGGFGGGMIGGGMIVGLTLNRNWDMVTRFKSLFDPITAKHIKGEITETGTDLIDDYTADIAIPTEGRDTFYSNGNTYYSYYDNKLKSLVVIMLK